VGDSVFSRRDQLRRSARRACLLVALLGPNVLTATQSANAAPISFDEARSALRSVSDQRKSGEAGVSKSELQARSADSLGLPTLSVDATEIGGIKTGTISNTPLGPIHIFDNLRGPRSSVNTTWSIYTGGRITATQRALAASADEARADLAITEEQLDLQLTQVYFGLELALNIERTRSALVEQADRQLERAQHFEQRGIIPKVERLNAQVSRDEAARELVRARRDREIAQARLQRLLRRSTPVETSTPLFVITDSLKPLPEWLSVAERQNPVLAVYGAKREQAVQGIAIAESAWMPEVFAFGNYALIKHYQSITEPDWKAGIGVSFTLFATEDRKSKVSAAREGLRQVQSLEAETRNNLDIEVETSYRKVEQAREQFALLDSTLVLARENLRLRERGFDEGQTTSLDVNDARNALARAETSRALAAYDFVVALAQLLQASGQANTLPEFLKRADIQLRQ
jgi:outer membrane protein TolC